MLRHTGFRGRVCSDLTQLERNVVAIQPAMIAIELPGIRGIDAFEVGGRLRADARAREIPVTICGDRLQAHDIENASRTGLLWVQVGSDDNLKLNATIRGVRAGRATADAP
jgi:hypothetical protein